MQFEREKQMEEMVHRLDAASRENDTLRRKQDDHLAKIRTLNQAVDNLTLALYLLRNDSSME